MALSKTSENFSGKFFSVRFTIFLMKNKSSPRQISGGFVNDFSTNVAFTHHPGATSAVDRDGYDLPRYIFCGASCPHKKQLSSFFFCCTET